MPCLQNSRTKKIVFAIAFISIVVTIGVVCYFVFTYISQGSFTYSTLTPINKSTTTPFTSTTSTKLDAINTTIESTVETTAKSLANITSAFQNATSTSSLGLDSMVTIGKENGSGEFEDN